MSFLELSGSQIVPLFILLVLKVAYRTPPPRLPAAGGPWEVIARERGCPAAHLHPFRPDWGPVPGRGSIDGWGGCRRREGLAAWWPASFSGIVEAAVVSGETDRPSGRGAMTPSPVDPSGGSCLPAANWDCATSGAGGTLALPGGSSSRLSGPGELHRPKIGIGRGDAAGVVLP